MYLTLSQFYPVEGLVSGVNFNLLKGRFCHFATSTTLSNILTIRQWRNLSVYTSPTALYVDYVMSHATYDKGWKHMNRGNTITKKTHGLSVDTPVGEVKGPNVFERVKGGILKQ